MNREFSVSYYNIVRYMQAARMRLPWVGHGYTAFEKHEPQMTRRLLMRAQYVRVPHPANLDGASFAHEFLHQSTKEQLPS